MTNRFLKTSVGLLAILYPVAGYLLAFALGGLQTWVYLPLLAGSLVHSCWLFHFCEEEWLDFKPGLFWVPICITTAFTLYWAGTYLFAGLTRQAVAPVLRQCLMLYVCTLLPYFAGVIARKLREHLLIMPSYQRPSRLTVTIYALVITTPLLYLVTLLAVEICYVAAGYQGDSGHALATPESVLALEVAIFAVLFYGGFPLCLLARYLFKRQGKPKPKSFDYF